MKKNKADEALGTELVLDLWRCNPSVLRDVKGIKTALFKAAKVANAKPLKFSSYKFGKPGFGFTAVLIISESSIGVHTYPERRYVALNVFTCGDRAVPKAAALDLIKYFQSKNPIWKKIKRGVPPRNPTRFPRKPRAKGGT